MGTSARGAGVVPPVNFRMTPPQKAVRYPDKTSGSPGTAFDWGGGQLIHAWPAATDENQYTQVRRSNVETLVIGGALDMAAPPQNATRELLPSLPNGHQLVLPELGHMVQNAVPDLVKAEIETMIDRIVPVRAAAD